MQYENHSFRQLVPLLNYLTFLKFKKLHFHSKAEKVLLPTFLISLTPAKVIFKYLLGDHLY